MRRPHRLPAFNPDEGYATFLADLRAWVFSSQAKAARAFGLANSTVVRYENGERTPPPGYLATLAMLIMERIGEEKQAGVEVRESLLREANYAIQVCYPDTRTFHDWPELCRYAGDYLAQQRIGSGPAGLLAVETHRDAGVAATGQDSRIFPISTARRVPPPGPTGTTTFLFIESAGSPEGEESNTEALRRYHLILKTSIEAAGGSVFHMRGDIVYAAFRTAVAGVAAALRAQRAIRAEQWSGQLQARMVLHTVPAGEQQGDRQPATNRNPLYRQISRLLSTVHPGQILLSAATRELVHDDLPADAGLLDLGNHVLVNSARPEHLYQLVVPDLPSAFPALQTAESLPGRLPIQVTSFIGREHELEKIRHLLGETRLLTLTGTGGVGKTRLALQVATELQAEYFDGVRLVELAALADPKRVTPAIAASLGIHEEADHPLLETIIEYLYRKRLLLVLDNCEHLIHHCAEVANHLLQTCPALQVLATSREALRIPGEKTLRVPSLSVPGLDPLPPLVQLEQYEAVRLFVERATHVQPTFSLTERNAEAVAGICRRLDGIPLALELCAARIRIMTVEQMAQRIDDRFNLLTYGSRTALPRHQTLRALIDWSYDLLTEAERLVLRRLAIFSGGWTLDAAEWVCAVDAGDAGSMLDWLTQLADKSIIVSDEQNEGEVRFHMSETIRQYAQEKLSDSGEAGLLHDRHLSFYLQLAEEAEPRLGGPEQVAWLERLELEHENLRSALAWSVEQQPERALRLAGALWRFWLIRGHLSEGRGWLEAIRSAGRSAASIARLKILIGAALLAWAQGDVHRAEQFCVESETIPATAGDSYFRAMACYLLGNLADQRGDTGQAAHLWEAGLQLARQAEDRWCITLLLARLGLVAFQRGDIERAIMLDEESLALARQVGDMWSMALALRNLGDVANEQSNYARARARYAESSALFRQLGEKDALAGTLLGLARLLLRQNECGLARHYYAESVALFRSVGDPASLATALAGLGLGALYQRDYSAARAWANESLALRQEHGDQHALANSLTLLGLIAYHQKLYAEARALLEESLAIWRNLVSKDATGWTLNLLGRVVLAQSQPEQAWMLQQESLALRREVGNKLGMVECLESMAAIAVVQGRAVQAACFFGLAATGREALQAPLPPVDQPGYAVTIAEIRNILDVSTFDAAWNAGRRAALERPLHEAVWIAIKEPDIEVQG